MRLIDHLPHKKMKKRKKPLSELKFTSGFCAYSIWNDEIIFPVYLDNLFTLQFFSLRMS
jgi:hypothetical protein